MLLLTLLSCRPDGADVPEPAGDTAAETVAASVDVPAGGCDGPVYDWLPTADMGILIDADIPDGLSISAQTMELLLSGFADTAALPAITHDVQTHHVRYTTQARGEAVEATGMVVFPDVEAAEAFPVVLWLHPTMGFSDGCAPTAIGLEGAAFPMLFASLGFVVVAPDYLGMSGWGAPSSLAHPYIVAEPTAVASLDLLRAAVPLSETVPAALDLDRVIYWGVSQGGHAALWVDRYAPHYGPAHTAVGSIAAIPPTDLLALTALGVQSANQATLGAAAILSASAAWYQTDHSLSEVLVEGMDEAVPALMEQACNDFSSLGEIAEVSDMFTEQGIAALSEGGAESLSPWSCYLEQGSIRTTAIPHESDTPTLVILAEDDDLAFAGPARDDVAALCDQGYRIEHVECAGAGHVDGGVDTLALQADWALQRAAGAAWDAAVCVINEPIDCAGEEQ